MTALRISVMLDIVPLRLRGGEDYLVGAEHVGQHDPLRGCAPYLPRRPRERIVALGLGDDDLIVADGDEVGLGHGVAGGVSQFQFRHVVIPA